MLFLGVLLYIFDVFVQPQLFIPAILNWRLDFLVMGPIIILWALGLHNAKRTHFLDSQQGKLMVMFFIIIMLSTISVSWLSYSLNTFIGWGKIVLIFFAIINIVNSYNKLRVVIWISVWGLTITACLGILQHHGIDYFGTGLIQGRIRGIGIFTMNQLAHVLAFLIPMILYLFKSTKRILLKLLLLIILLIYYYTILLTQSRGGLLCSVMIIAIFFMLFTKSKSIKIFGFFISVGLFILFLQISPRLQTISSYSTESSAKGRLDVWGEALMVFKNYPILGVGKDQFREHAFIAPHNSYIQTLTELGFFGLFIWLAFFYFSFKNLKYLAVDPKKSITEEAKVLAKCFQVSLCAYLISSFFSGSAYYETLYIILALIVVLQVLTKINTFTTRIFIAKDIISILSIEIAIIFVIRLLVT